jgi:hypothetical protein
VADLFTLTELGSWLQRTIASNDPTGTLARSAATSIVENYCRTSFTTTDTSTEYLKVRDGYVLLPKRPVVSVTSVKAIESDGTPGATIAGWTFNGIDRVWLSGLTDVVINRSEALFEQDVDVVEVVYDYGWATVPDDVKHVALELAGNYYSNPTGLRQETVGGYSVTYAGSNEVFGIALTPGQKAILDRYRVKATTVRTGVSWR